MDRSCPGTKYLFGHDHSSLDHSYLCNRTIAFSFDKSHEGMFLKMHEKKLFSVLEIGAEICNDEQLAEELEVWRADETSVWWLR